MKSIANSVLVYLFEIELSELSMENSKELQFWGGLIGLCCLTVLFIGMIELLQH